MIVCDRDFMTLRPSRYTLGIVLQSIHFLVDTPYTQVNTCRARFTMVLVLLNWQ